MWEWLSSADGQELTHAVIVLLLTAAGYLSWRTHQDAKADRAKRRDEDDRRSHPKEDD